MVLWEACYVQNTQHVHPIHPNLSPTTRAQEALKENAVQEPPVKKAAPKKSRGITFLPKKKQAPPAQGAGGRGPVPALALGRIGVDEDIDAGSGVAGRILIGF